MEKRDLLRPEMFLVAYALFLVLAWLGFQRGFPIETAGMQSFLVVLLTFPLFIFGVHLSSRVYGKKVPQFVHFIIIAVLIAVYLPIMQSFSSMPTWINVFLIVSPPIVFYFVIAHFHSRLVNNKFFASVSALGFVFLALALWTVGGIPLFNHALRGSLLTNGFWGLAVYFVLAGLAFLLPRLKNNWHFWGLSIISIALFALMAFRTIILTLILLVVFIAYYTKRITWRGIALAAVVAFLLIAGLGYYVQPLLNPADLVLYRASTTHLVFEDITEQAGSFGLTHGTAFMQGNPRNYVGSLLGKNLNLTYTFLGAAFLDFGVLGGAAWMLFIGFLLGLAYNAMKKDKLFAGVYPLLFALAIVWIELGIDPFKLLLFWLFVLVYLVRYRS